MVYQIYIDGTMRPEVLWIEQLMKGPFEVIIDPDIILGLFFMISGYLAARKRIPAVKDLLHACLFRWLRFAVPFLLFNLVLWLMSRLHLFETQTVGNFYGNAWISDQYSGSITLMEAVSSALLLNAHVNRSLWVLQMMFLANLVIYLYDWLRERIGKALASAGVMILSAALYYFHVLPFAYIYLETLMWILNAEFPAFKRKSKWTDLLLMIVILMPMGLHEALFENLPFLSHFTAYGSRWAVIYVLLFLLLIRNPCQFRSFLEWKGWRKIYPLSFPLFVINLPVICSFSMWLFKLLIQRMSFEMTLDITLIITCIIMIPAAAAYEETIQAWSDKLILFLRNCRKIS